MNGSDLGDPLAWPAILALACLSMSLRMAGFWLMRFVPQTVRLRRMLEALPGSVIIAAILPGVVRGGAVPMLAVAAALVVMYRVRNDFAAVLAAMAVAAGCRAAGF